MTGRDKAWLRRHFGVNDIVMWYNESTTGGEQLMCKVKSMLNEVYSTVRNSLVLFGMIFLSAVVISTPIIVMQAAVTLLDGGF